jgi:hypothetical protein
MSFPNESDPIKPWSWNLPLELIVWFVVALIVVLVWTWTRSGKDRKNLPDVVGRNIEDFAGVTTEGNGPIPLFLLIFYAIVASFMIGYPIVTLIVGYKY